MKPRQNQGVRPEITFTSDFHELVLGDLLAGPCLLHYDPLRLVKLGDDAQGGRTIKAFARFHPGQGNWEGQLWLPAGLPLAAMADPCGQGLMLETTLEIPPGCDELEIWFSCTHGDGRTHWDSDFGRNHWIRFGLADLAIQSARVVPETGGGGLSSGLKVECSSVAKVEAVSLRWRLPSSKDSGRQITPLQPGGAGGLAKTWQTPAGGLPVPAGATVVFDLVYWVGGRAYTDDNQGRWYIAD